MLTKERTEVEAVNGLLRWFGRNGVRWLLSGFGRWLRTACSVGIGRLTKCAGYERLFALATERLTVRWLRTACCSDGLRCALATERLSALATERLTVR